MSSQVHQLPTPASSTDTNHPHQSSVSAAPSSNGMNLFVANLSNDVTDDLLFKAFSSYGKILTCKVMLDIHTGVSRGFGFVLFERQDEGSRAMSAIHGTVLGAKQVYVSVAQTNGHSGLQHTPKLYVRNVPNVHTLEVLRDHFAQYGEIVRINFRDDQTQSQAPPEHRQYLATTTVLFIEYRTSEQAEAAVRCSHNTRPWPNMEIPLLAKPAETSQMRNERRQRMQAKTGSTTQNNASATSGGSPNQSGTSNTTWASIPSFGGSGSGSQTGQPVTFMTGHPGMLGSPTLGGMPLGMGMGMPQQGGGNMPIFYVPMSAAPGMPLPPMNMGGAPMTQVWPPMTFMMPANAGLNNMAGASGSNNANNVNNAGGNRF